MEPYTYRVIRYVHDPAVGETLNVGVLLYAPSVPYLGFRIEPLYERLSTTFANFNGDNYRTYGQRLETALRRWAERVQPNLGLYEAPKDLMALSRLIWPDMGGSFQPGPILAGITNDPDAELEALFERMVTSQYKRELKTRRTDDEVWTLYQRRLPVEVRRQYEVGPDSFIIKPEMKGLSVVRFRGTDKNWTGTNTLCGRVSRTKPTITHRGLAQDIE